MIKWTGESGSEYNEWNDINERIKKVEVRLFGTVEMPHLVLERYEKYMFQKYGTILMSSAGVKYDKFRGFQVGAYKKDADCWVVVNVDFFNKQLNISLAKSITSIAVKDGTG